MKGNAHHSRVKKVKISSRLWNNAKTFLQQRLHSLLTFFFSIFFFFLHLFDRPNDNQQIKGKALED